MAMSEKERLAWQSIIDKTQKVIDLLEPTGRFSDDLEKMEALIAEAKQILLADAETKAL